MTLSSEVPITLGYHMPAEWEPHEATWLAWPHNRSDWPGRFSPIPWVFGEIVRNLAAVERVHIIVADAAEEKTARRLLHQAGALNDRIQFHRWPTNRVWTRDYGPIFVVKHNAKRSSRSAPVALVNFGFNAWAKYPDWRDDDKIPGRIAKLLSLDAFDAEVNGRPFVLEGGSIDVNGLGTLLTTEECLLGDVQQRNPKLSRDDIERGLHDFLAITNVIWLERGIVGDDTHGHVDDITRFVNPTTVVTAVEPNRDDANHAILAANLRRLRTARDQDGGPLEIVEIPMPRPVVFSGQRLPASYANFYISNGLVLVPVFNDPNDRLALNMLAEAMPNHQIVPIYCGDFIWGLGAIHCATQQQPAATGIVAA
jgi:agmatine deiminase